MPNVLRRRKFNCPTGKHHHRNPKVPGTLAHQDIFFFSAMKPLSGGATMKTYGIEIREPLVRRMMPPENTSILELSRETGISRYTLYHWRRKARGTMATPIPGNGKRPVRWSGEDKFLAVLATASMNEAERAAYCRSKGIYSQELETWKRACIEAQEKGSSREDMKTLRTSLDKERKRAKELERELLRKEKALAETAALLALRKKARAIWGEDEEDS